MGNDKSDKKVMWYEVYHELAKELAKLNTEKLQKEFYEKCMSDKNGFRKQHNWTQVLEDKGHWNNPGKPLVEWGFYHNDKKNYHFKVERFDPMQIFASFNGFGMKEESRIKKINTYFSLLDSENPYKEKKIDFTGCPSPMMLPLVFMRHSDDIDILWEAFINIMDSKKEANIDFKEIKKCHGVSIESFTVLLFWIDSKNFLPLDKNTIALFETNNQEIKISNTKTRRLSKENNQIIDISEWKDYINFLNRNTTSSDEIYRVLARMAWNCTSELSDYEEDLANFGIKKCPNKSLKIIAIKPLGGCNPKFLKGLKENQIYLFDKAYTITIDDKMGIKKVEYNKENDIQLFNQDDLQININAIVGKNGAGKSTLIELLLAVINNVTYHQKKKKCIEYIPKLRVELIFEDLHIYKIIINNDEKIKLLKYEDNNWRKSSIRSKKVFYNILVNYSIHSLNNSEKNWIEPHFENKCGTDIVIEPFRENGNINIQKEEERVKKRLITNLLEPELEKDDYSFRQLTETYKAIKLVSSTKLGKSSKNEKIVKFYSKTNNLKECYDEHNIEILSNKIKDEKEEDESIEDFIPNNYFTDILLENDIKFSQLSSGEKQKIYSINSIIYHIQRLDKKKYKHVNLILDEIELYFHPELQRTYINDIIEAIKKVGTENILGINITFITHSPFILSDIPESKILFLNKESNDADAKTVPQDNGIQTFGANIHNLLNSSFFMKNGLMGEFAKKRIKKIVKQLNDHKEEKKLLTEAEQLDIKKVIQAIGEPFLNQKLWNMYQSLFNDTDAEEKRLNEEMARIQKKLESLKK